MTGLMTGADDYVTKPFSPAELTARVDALFRRAGGDVEEVPEGEIRKDPIPAEHPQPHIGEKRSAHQADAGGIHHYENVYGKSGKGPVREEILDMVWGHDYFGEVKIVDVNIRRLRLKIEDNPQNPTYITTVWGYGYKWGF